MIFSLQRRIETLLPDGCPFVIGGGLIRDAIFGGRPSDIDIWLPSNITIPGLSSFFNFAQLELTDHDWVIRFNGPGAEPNPLTTFPPVVENDGSYGDVNNHWVLEGQSNTHPTVNIMRSMTRWNGDSQEFFNGLMRAFDIDQCMFFIGLTPGQRTIDKVIVPRHMAEIYNSRRESPSNTLMLSSIYWNRFRLESTSRERISARITKMLSKYNFNPASIASLGGQVIAQNLYQLDVEQIVAVPVLLSNVMKKYNNNKWLARPTLGNSRYQEAS